MNIKANERVWILCTQIGRDFLAVICYESLCAVTKQATGLEKRERYEKAS
jgi:hypothetical protein